MGHKEGANLFLSVTLSKIDFNAFFTVKFRNERHMRQYELHPPHLISVATLIHESQNTENNNNN